LLLRGSNFLLPGEPTRNGEAVDGVLPTKLAGVCVAFGDMRAPLVGVSASQASVFVPALASEVTSVPVRVIVNCDLPGEVGSNTLDLTVAAATPELIVGGLPNDTRLFARFLNAERQLAPSGTATKAGATVTLLGIGFGATDPAVAPGTVLTERAKLAAPVTIRLNGEAVAAEAVTFAGLGLFQAGIYEVDVTLPAGLPPGEYTVEIVAGEKSTGATAIVVIEP
jgi:uncharacterized protein (TIGR03437 family)